MIIIKTTVNKRTIKKKIIDKLIINKYAACINVIEKVNSNYLWNGKLVSESEEILFIKTTKDKENIIYNIIKKMHNYEIPEISTIKTTKVDKSFQDWLVNATR